MSRFSLKPTHKAVTAYYDSLAKFAKLGVKHESAVRSAFATLLEHAAGQFDWKLVPESAIARKGAKPLIVNLICHLAETRKTALPQKFAEELFCNEVMLLPYYIASMNIEHAYYEAVGRYESFEGICLVDTFETINGHMSYHSDERHEQQDMVMFNPENTQRINRQKAAPIRVILANPPYNAGQINENDNNKNRKYPELDRRVSATYGTDSQATLLRKLADPYIKAIRYATDRIGDQGIVCYVNNNSFVTEKTFDGMRKHLARDFDLIYVLDLGGNVRKNPKLSGTTHNVFGIQVGVSINLFIKLPKAKNTPAAKAASKETEKEFDRELAKSKPLADYVAKLK